MKFDLGNEHYKHIVDYHKSLDQMIKAGAFQCVDPKITSEIFPFSDTGLKRITIRLLSLHAVASTHEALEVMAYLQLRPAHIEELIALATKTPRFRSPLKVVALGSTWFDPANIPHFVSFSGLSERRLCLHRVASEPFWHARVRYACVQM